MNDHTRALIALYSTEIKCVLMELVHGQVRIKGGPMRARTMPAVLVSGLVYHPIMENTK